MNIAGDVRYTVRSLAKNRAFAAAAILTVALGVGATTAAFSVVHAALLRPLPYPASDRLVAIHETQRQSPGERHAFSYPTFLDWQRDVQAIEQMAAHAVYGSWVVADGVAESLEGARVSWNYFRVLGVGPALGRDFSPDDDRGTAAPVIVISDKAWTRLFGRNPSAIGRVITVDGTPCTVIGVMPPNFAGPPDSTGIQDVAETWAPIARLTPGGFNSLRNRGAPWVSPVIARLRPGVTVSQVQRELDTVATRLAQQFRENRDRGAVVVALTDQVYGHIRPSLLVLFGVVGLVLLVTCVNVASVLLSRTTSRQRELAVRRALGASRGRITRLLITESLAISLAGGALGLLLAAWMTDALLALNPEPLPRFVHVGIDVPVLAFTLLLCVAVGMLIGLAPSLMSAGVDVQSALKTGSHGHSETASPRIRRALVSAEIACAVVVVIGSGLMLRTLERLRSFDPGFNLSGVMSVGVRATIVGPQGQSDPTQTESFWRPVLERVRAMPAVQDASLSWDLPLTDMWMTSTVGIEREGAELIRVRRHSVAPSFFRTLRIPVLEGRDLEPADVGAGERDVVVIAHTLARTLWPGTSAIGQRLRWGQRTFEIVGVVGDVRHRSLLEAERFEPDVYFSLYQVPQRGFNVVVRTASPPGLMAAAIQRVVRELSPAAAIIRVRTGEEIFSMHLRRQRFMSALLSAFALVALALTVVGIYGVTAYHVGRQTRQIGIRVALGATRHDVLRLVLGHEWAAVASGLVIGILAASGLSWTLASFVYGVSLTDAVTYALAALLLAVVGVAACLVPARRAASIDPVIALRAD
jgi:predicted permease